MRLISYSDSRDSAPSNWQCLNVTDTRTCVRAKLCWLCTTFSDLFQKTKKIMFSKKRSNFYHIFTRLRFTFRSFSAISCAKSSKLTFWPHEKNPHLEYLFFSCAPGSVSWVSWSFSLVQRSVFWVAGVFHGCKGVARRKKRRMFLLERLLQEIGEHFTSGQGHTEGCALVQTFLILIDWYLIQQPFPYIYRVSKCHKHTDVCPHKI